MKSKQESLLPFNLPSHIRNQIYCEYYYLVINDADVYVNFRGDMNKFWNDDHAGR